MISWLDRSKAGRPGTAEAHLVERVRLLHEQADVGLAGSLICAVLVYGALLPNGNVVELSAWAAVTVALTAGRAWLIKRFRRTPPHAQAVRRWLRWYLLGTACAGAAYGYAGLVLLQGQPKPLHLLMYLVLAALTAGSVATYSAVVPVFLAFILPALLPLFLHFALTYSGFIGLVYAAGTLVFTAVLTFSARKQSRSIAQSLEIKFENLDLIATLEAAKGKAEALNDSLKAEIAERRRVEADLARTVALYQATMDAVDEGILAIDSEQRVLAVNQRFRELWNLTEDDLVVGGTVERVLARTVEQMANGESYLTEYAAQAIDDPEPHRNLLIGLADGRVFERHSFPYRLHGEVVGRVRTVQDVTARITSERELRRAKEAAEAANRAKSDFLAHISHELRTPLNAIIGFSDIFRREMFGELRNERYLSYAHDIHDSATLLLSLINDILDLSKIEAGRTELVEGRISVPHLVAATLRLVRGRALAAGIKISDRTAKDLPLLHGDERACKQMLANLLTNAVKFTEAGGQVEVAAGLTRAGELALTVTDTGIGMAAKDIPRALEPFSQIESPMTRRHEGTGLGLPLVASLVRAHGGRLELESEPGQGTTARLVFPAARLEPGKPQGARQVVAGRRSAS